MTERTALNITGVDEQRACLLAHQLSRFASSNGAAGGSVEQPVWDEEDDMKPSNQPKRRERRRSRAPRFSDA